MPSRKSVLPLGNLCVLSLAQLLVDIIELSSKDLASATNGQEKPSEASKSLPQIRASQLNLSSENTTEDPGKGESSNDGEKVVEQGAKDKASDNEKKEEVREEESSNNESGKDEPRSEGEKVAEEEAKGKSSEDKTADKEEIEKDSSTSNEEEKRRVEDVESQNRKSQQDVAKELERLREELGMQLTSHSHVTLHELLFSTIITRIDGLYMHHKKIRRAVQDILPHFLNSSLRELDFGRTKMFSETEMCKILFENLHKACNLRKLMIGRSCYWRSKIFENLNVKLKHLPHLTQLAIQYICTPEMIKDLAESCPNLCDLNLKGSEKITDLQCDELAKCSSLKMLDISGTRITGRGCWKVVESIKNLSWLQHCAFNCNSDSLLFESRADLFERIKEQVLLGDATTLVRPDLSVREERFNIKNFWLFNPQTEDLLTSVLFPHLEHFRLDFVFQDMRDDVDVSILTAQPKLAKLQANLYDRCSVDLVRRMLEACGNKLVSLDLHLADDWFFVAEAHNVVAACCPNLVDLTFSGDYKARHSLEDSDERLDLSIQSPAHPRLENLSLTGVVSNRRLRFVLSHTPALRTLHLDGELEWLHDATFTSILETNPLTELEEVWFNVSTTVTLDTVRLLLLHENNLRIVGRLCHMGGASMEEYQELLALVRHQNLDTKLIWVTDQRIK